MESLQAGRAGFSGSALVCIIQGILPLSMQLLKNPFTGSWQKGVPQSKSPAGNGSAPSPAGGLSISLWCPSLPDTAFFTDCRQSGTRFWISLLSAAGGCTLRSRSSCKSAAWPLRDTWNKWTVSPSCRPRICRFSGILYHLSLNSSSSFKAPSSVGAAYTRFKSAISFLMSW